MSARALGRLGWGVFKSYAGYLLLNDKLRLDVFASGGEALGHGRLWLWTAELYFLFYLAFSAWIDVAIALATMTGARVPENFRRPWAAVDVADFWRRWHITFGDWLRTYVYIPLGGNRRHQVLNVLLVFLVSALWLVWGALKILGLGGFPPSSWVGFLLWGGINAAAVIAAKWWSAPAFLPGRLARQAATFVIVALAWVPFFLPPGAGLGDCLAVFARLAFLR